MKRGSKNSGFAGMAPEARRAAQSRGGKAAQARRSPRLEVAMQTFETLLSTSKYKQPHVGFWFDGPFSTFPNPYDLVDTKWNATERERVVRYLCAGKQAMAWMGYSWCRFECGIDDSAMGVLDLTDGIWIWPEGFAHYVEKHDVKPPREFVEFVLSRKHNV